MESRNCRNCGQSEYVDVLDFGPKEIKGLCESCANEMFPERRICRRCETEWATYVPPPGIQAEPTCDKCANDGAYLAYCLNSD